MFQSLPKAIKWIESIKRFGDKYDLSRIKLACKLLDNPEQSLPVIHIAGTNGKGSTVAFLRSIYLKANLNVGTYTSPYITRFQERITYNGNDISDKDLLYYINIVYKLHHQVKQDYNEVITFFELVTLISFLYFNALEVDVVLYEVGLGGTLDATNVVSPLITAITSISYDHMKVLGNTLPEIASNKLGIVKENIPLLTTVDNDTLYQQFNDVTSKHNSKLIWITKADIKNISYGAPTQFKYHNQSYAINLLGTHQVMNAVLAIEIAITFALITSHDISIDDIQQGLLHARWPGRMESFGNIILDGAHNIGGILALKETVNVLFKDKKIIMVYTSMKDKDYKRVLHVIDEFVDELYLTTFPYERCAPSSELYDASNHPNKHKSNDSYNTLESLVPISTDTIVLVTGSLYFISYMRPFIKDITT